VQLEKLLYNLATVLAGEMQFGSNLWYVYRSIGCNITDLPQKYFEHKLISAIGHTIRTQIS